jgi:hypothetical protein
MALFASTTADDCKRLHLPIAYVDCLRSGLWRETEMLVANVAGERRRCHANAMSYQVRMEVMPLTGNSQYASPSEMSHTWGPADAVSA